ncbi:MAG: segregation/condensation protein A [Chloroflexaceae bacterium]|nr:segregation/condensation protein A [Chloroflexaceae bacterium]
MYTITLPTFAGPLDLLLQLIERAELDITTIALAQVADQYLAHVRSLESPEPRALAEFIALAARLLLIKSRALLPRPAIAPQPGDGNAVDDAEALTRQLREYQRYKHAAQQLKTWQEEERRTFLRTAPPPLPPPPDNVPLDNTLADMIAAVQRRMQLLLPLEDTAALNLPSRLTVADVRQNITQRLATQRWISFENLLSLATSRQEIIVTFWAVLEMWKRYEIAVEQTDLFGPISIGRPTAHEDG